jgi:RNA polymerase sigma factor (sigma-70 family)
MTTNHSRTALGHLLRALRPDGEAALTDGQLLARFVASRDEPAFAALVRRHGPMVLGVCRRVLCQAQDAEDAFQATFLTLSRKAGSVANRRAVGSWLYRVAYRIALEAKAINDRRRGREQQVADVPHPEVAPVEPKDWRPWLDHELNRLAEKYRSAILLCDLEGRSRKEAARQLRVPEGTLSSRLVTARRLLAKRLSRYGLSLSGGALAEVLSQSSASAHVPASLLSSTTKAAVGQVGISMTVDCLVKGALQTMLLAKLKLAVGAVMVVVALGASGLFYRVMGQSAPAGAERKLDSKPRSELEALRRENELLKLNLEVVLEKVRAQEAELRALREQVKAAQKGTGLGVLNKLAPDGKGVAIVDFDKDGIVDLAIVNETKPDPMREAEAALKAMREAPDRESQRRAADQLERALKVLRERMKKPEGPGK